MNPELARAVQVLWELASIAFLVGVVLTVRKARARGQRLFVTGPTERSKALHQSPVDHSWDGFQ